MFLNRLSRKVQEINRQRHCRSFAKPNSAFEMRNPCPHMQLLQPVLSPVIHTTHTVHMYLRNRRKRESSYSVSPRFNVELSS